MPVNGIDDATNTMEEHLPEQQASPKLRLKDGSEVDARKAYVIWRMLVSMEHDETHDLRLLAAFARGEEDKFHPMEQASLRKKRHQWFTADGSLEPLHFAVFSSAYRETGDGPVVVDPFQLRTDSDIDTYNHVQREHAHAMRWLRRRVFGNDPPDSKSR